MPRLPPAYSERRLLANLEALERSDPELAGRLRLPVADDGVAFGPDGTAALRVHRSTLPLELAAATARELAAGTGSGPRRPLVLGIGLGELVEAALARHWAVLAWDRDPWLVRLALMRLDLRAPLRDGRLRLALAGDLAAEAGTARDRAVIRHPILARLYLDEARALDEGLGPRRALVVTGGLVVEPLAARLRERGFATWPLEARRHAVEELDRTARSLAPELVVAVNWVDGLAEFCRERGLRLASWEIDPATTAPRPPACPTDHAAVFAWREASVAEFRAAGFERVEWLPLGADPEQRRPVELDPAERARYAAPIAFVGSSLALGVAPARARFVEAIASAEGGGEAARARAEALLRTVLDEQRRDGSRYLVPELLEERAGALLAAARERPGATDPAAWAGEIAAAEKRLGYAARLGALGLHVWGDEGWRRIEPTGARWRGPAGHAHELNRIYSAAAIQLDLNRIYQPDIVTMRVFDALACGAFPLVEHSSDLERLFEVGAEVESFRTADEMVAKARAFIAEPAKARAIAERGRRAVLERHTIGARLDAMLARIAPGRGGTVRRRAG